MQVFDPMATGSLERREMQLIALACSAIIVLAVGLALFMYPVVFSQKAVAPSNTMPIAFFGFCALSILLAIYLLNRQATIGRLRMQIAEEREIAAMAMNQASAEWLEALPNFGSFQDQLTMEYRRGVASKQNLSVLVITTTLGGGVSESTHTMSFPGDAAKAISRKLREQDSIYIMADGIFGVILPGLNGFAAKRVSERLAEGLSDAAGINNRFSFRVDSVSYPEQAVSARGLELAVRDLLPEYIFGDTLTRH